MHEFKIREVNREWIVKELEKNGAEKLSEHQLITTYYDDKSSDFIASGKRLSITSDGNSAVLSFKDKHMDVGYGVSNEFEVTLSDGETMEKILRGMDFRDFTTFEKNRIEYQYKDVIISFDKYSGDHSYVPEFMILESENERKIFELAELIGYTKNDCEVITVLDLIRHYRSH